MQFIDENARRQLEQCALTGELARSMVHEFSNFLNMFLLQITVLELSGPIPPGLNLEVFRKEGKKMANLIRTWHGLADRKLPRSERIDINQIIRDLSADPLIESASADQVDLELSEEPLWIKGNQAEMRRLCWLLIRSRWNRNENAAPGKRIRVRTEKKEQEVLMTIGKASQPLSSLELEELFDPTRSVGSGLELAVCRSLVLRLNGRLCAENQPTGIDIHFVAAVANP